MPRDPAVRVWQFDLQIREPVDSANRKRLIQGMGARAIPPRGDMPKYRVPSVLRGRNHVIPHNHIY